MRIKYVHACDYRRSEYTNFLEAMPELEKAGIKLQTNDVVLLTNNARTNLIAVWSIDELPITGRPSARVVRSMRIRIPDGGSWSPATLKWYLEQHGIQVEGLKRFDDYYKDARTALGLT